MTTANTSKWLLNDILPRPSNGFSHTHFSITLTEREAHRECNYQMETLRNTVRLHVPPQVLEARHGRACRYSRPYVPLVYFGWIDEPQSGLTDGCFIWLHTHRNPELLHDFGGIPQEDRERSRLVRATAHPEPVDADGTGVTDFPFCVEGSSTWMEIRSIATWTPLHIRRGHGRVVWNTLARAGWEILDRGSEAFTPLLTAYRKRGIVKHGITPAILQ